MKNSKGSNFKKAVVSVITPVYNTPPDFLRKTLNSALEQTHSKLEIIVVDDGSTIPFSGIKKEFKDKRIQWATQKENGGVAKARNAAIEKSSGEYVAFLDAGDWWEPDKIARQLELFESSSLKPVLIYNGICTHDPVGKIIRLKPSRRGNLYRALLVGQPVLGSCASVIVQHAALECAGGKFYDEADLSEDRELWLRISKTGNFDYIPEPLSHVRVGDPGRRSFDPEKKKVTHFRIIELYTDELKKEGLYKTAVSKYHFRIGKRYNMAGRKWTAVKYFWLSFTERPSWKGLFWFCLLLLSYATFINFMKISKSKNSIQDDQ